MIAEAEFREDAKRRRDESRESVKSGLYKLFHDSRVTRTGPFVAR